VNTSAVNLLMGIFFIILGLRGIMFREKWIRKTAEFEYKWFHIPKHLTDTRFARRLAFFAGVISMVIGLLMLFGIL